MLVNGAIQCVDADLTFDSIESNVTKPSEMGALIVIQSPDNKALNRSGAYPLVGRVAGWS
jgi:hypothetical protein